ncbi:MAG: dihydrolipoyl dehydrogenase [Candidatus Omnitrophica bacterium]|nr:dihydrolipoyl dehydrogenase [Candidatus Omnitrophota bacterium]
MTKYDLAVIGSGPGGYVAALYACRHKLKTCVIEKDLTGGTCLNRGCIPTKSFIHSAGIYKTVKEASLYGVEASGVRADFGRMVSRKNDVVLRLRTGVETLFRANKVDLVKGEAQVSGPNTISVSGQPDISTKYTIVASGSSVMELPNIKIDHNDILSSDDILDIKDLPESIAIIGGGVIGCEFASLFNTLGSKVTIVEFTERLIPTQSREASKKLEMIFKRRGIDVLVSSKAESVEKRKVLKLSVSGGKTIEIQKVLISIGRGANTDCVKESKCGVKKDGGRIVVDDHLQTGERDVYAIGDCVAGPMLAHKASYDAMVACDNMLGKIRKVNYSNIPNCIWTDPEIASVGMGEEEAKAKYPDARIAKFPYLGSGKALLMEKSEGFAKIIGDANGAILGVEIFGEGACDLIAEAVLAKTSNINIKDWARSVHGHPTLSEVLQEALHIFCANAYP